MAKSETRDRAVGKNGTQGKSAPTGSEPTVARRAAAKRTQEIANRTPPAPAAGNAPAGAIAEGGASGGDGRASRGIRSYALLERDTMALYMSFYKHTYSKSTLDRKTKEFIAISAALATGCKNCLEGHLKKAIKHGATRAEISEVMAVTLGVAAATMVDRSDIAAANIQLDPETWTLADDD